MDQGNTNVNGPHQGAWVTTQTGEDWFLHFQDKGVYGRVVHLEPMKWINNWPVIGIDKNGDGKGEPVLTYKKPNVGKTYPITTPAESDEFNSNMLGLQWQWMANPQPYWYFIDPAKGLLRLFSANEPDSTGNLWDVPNVLLQKFPAEEFRATVKMTFHHNEKLKNEKAGLAIMGFSYADINLVSKSDGMYLTYDYCKDADKVKKEKNEVISKLSNGLIYLRVSISRGAVCDFSYSFDGNVFKNVGNKFMAAPGRWIGAKVGIFCTREDQTNDSGYADFDWFRIERY